jgi:hypothetical protein
MESLLFLIKTIPTIVTIYTVYTTTNTIYKTTNLFISPFVYLFKANRTNPEKGNDKVSSEVKCK